MSSEQVVGLLVFVGLVFFVFYKAFAGKQQEDAAERAMRIINDHAGRHSDMRRAMTEVPESRNLGDVLRKQSELQQLDRNARVIARENAFVERYNNIGKWIDLNYPKMRKKIIRHAGNGSTYVDLHDLVNDLDHYGMGDAAVTSRCIVNWDGLGPFDTAARAFELLSNRLSADGLRLVKRKVTKGNHVEYEVEVVTVTW